MVVYTFSSLSAVLSPKPTESLIDWYGIAFMEITTSKAKVANVLPGLSSSFLCKTLALSGPPQPVACYTISASSP